MTGSLTTDPVLCLEKLDAQISKTSEPRTLDPNRLAATPLRELIESFDLLDEERNALARGMGMIASAVLDAFPENIYWDFDYLASSLLRRSGGQTELLLSSAKRIAELHVLFGQKSAIRFRYIHDFLYGFDWAKWVKRDPSNRSNVGPFDRRFIAYTYGRGHELLALIDADDEKYHRLGGQEARNPFGFSREPEDEMKVLSLMRDRGELPVETFRVDAVPDFQKEYVTIRLERAAELRLLRPKA